MVNQLEKFTLELTELSHTPYLLWELLSRSRTWTWSAVQEAAFKQVTEDLSKPTTLAHYDPGAPTKISVDASSFGLGAVLLQKQETQWRPIAYASHSMSDTTPIQKGGFSKHIGLFDLCHQEENYY